MTDASEVVRESNLIVALPSPRSIAAIAQLNGRILEAIHKQHSVTLTLIAGSD